MGVGIDSSVGSYPLCERVLEVRIFPKGKATGRHTYDIQRQRLQKEYIQKGKASIILRVTFKRSWSIFHIP